MESTDIGKIITSIGRGDTIIALKELNKIMDELGKTIVNNKVSIAVLDGIENGLVNIKNVSSDFKNILDIEGIILNGVKSLGDFQKTISTTVNAMHSMPVAEGLISSSLNVLQLGFALLTGQMTLHEVATAIATKVQLAFNAVMEANPILLVVGAIALLTGAVIGIISWLQKGTKEEQEMAEAMKKKADVAADLNKSYSDMQQNQQNNINSGLSELSQTQRLSDELKRLADEKGNVADKDKGRVAFILGELNDAFGTEYKLVDNQIQKYEDLMASIDEYIEKKRLQVLFDGREAEYREALCKIIDTQKAKEQAKMDIEQAIENFNNHKTKANAERVLEAQRQYDELNGAYNKMSNDIQTYENAMTANLEGNSKKAEEILKTKGYYFQSFDDTVSLGAEEQTRVLQQQQDEAIRNLQRYGENYKKEVEGFTAEGLSQAIDYVQKSRDAYSKVGQSMVDGASDGIDSRSEAFRATSDNVFSIGPVKQIERNLGIQSPSKVFAGIGKNIVDGASEGISNNRQSFISKTTSLFSSAISSVKSALGISSPSKVFAMIGENTALGYMQGIEDNADSVVDSMQNMIDEAVKTAEKGSYRLADISGLSDINSTVTSSIQHKVNTEDDGLIDKINELAQKDTNIYCKVQLGEDTIFNKIIEGIKQKSFERNEEVFSV